MRTWWIRFGCFLTGYNYNIVKVSSEVTAKAVKRYTSALLIVCILWFFVGFTFTSRYLYANLTGSIIGAIIMVVIVIQIERQIILAITPGKALYFARGVLAMLMAIVGSIIIDQIIFKEDIELEKITYLGERVDKALPSRTRELRYQIATLDTAIKQKDSEKTKLMVDVNKMPFIKSTISQTIPTKVTTSTRDSSGRLNISEKVIPATSVITNNVPNPKLQQIPPLEQTISNFRKQKSDKEDSLLTMRPRLEREIQSKVGFLDELKVMYRLVASSGVALSVWIIWFLFLMWLEMLILISKLSEKKNDYEETIMHQMTLQKYKLELLARSTHRG